MKNKIEIGEFIRFKNGKINKVDKDDAERLNIFNDNVAKHSKNIIDLIEVGDYVNGYRVIELIRLSNEEISICVYKDKEYMHCEILKEKDIKTILTHEMYEQNCYEVEE